MRIRSAIASLCVAYCLALYAAYGQAAVVKRNVNLRVGPSTSTAVVELLLPGGDLTILDPVEQNNYLNVRAADGEEVSPSEPRFSRWVPGVCARCLRGFVTTRGVRRSMRRRPAPHDLVTVGTSELTRHRNCTCCASLSMLAFASLRTSTDPPNSPRRTSSQPTTCWAISDSSAWLSEVPA